MLDLNSSLVDFNSFLSKNDDHESRSQPILSIATLFWQKRRVRKLMSTYFVDVNSFGAKSVEHESRYYLFLSDPDPFFWQKVTLILYKIHKMFPHFDKPYISLLIVSLHLLILYRIGTDIDRRKWNGLTYQPLPYLLCNQEWYQVLGPGHLIGTYFCHARLIPFVFCP